MKTNASSDDRTNIIFGASVDEQLAGQMWVTVVATGLSRSGSTSSTRSNSEPWLLCTVIA